MDTSRNAFPRLFSPLRIGPLAARNRIVFGAHFTMFSEPAPQWGEPGYCGARLGRYLEDRARGGAGVIIVGQAQVHPTTAYQMPNNAVAWDEAAIPHFEDVTAPIHAHGALAFLQLAHNGGVKPPHRRVRRQPGESDALCRAGAHRGARRRRRARRRRGAAGG